MASIYLIRHGQASFGKRNYDQLSSKGFRQAAQLGKALQSRVPASSRIWCGPMQRHQQTANGFLETFSTEHNHTPIILDQLAEIDHEDIIIRARPLYRSRTFMIADLLRTLKPGRTFQAFFEQAITRWASGEYDHEYRETWPAFRSRCLAALEQIAEQTDDVSVVFTSAGPITAISQELCGIKDENMLELNQSLVNCGVTKIIKGRQQLRISTLNDHGFFESTPDLISYR